MGGRDLDSYFELHIEQGPALEAANVPLGIVVGGYFSGAPGEFAARTPRYLRLWTNDNALVGASIVVAANDIGWEYHKSEGKSTATRLLLWPNKPGILPDWAQLTVDFRHPDKAVTLEMEAKMREAIKHAEARAQVEVEVTSTWEFGDEAFDADCLQLLRDTANDLGVEFRNVDQAGHDAYHIHDDSHCTIFRHKEGSRNENAIELAYTEPSVNVLLRSPSRHSL